MKYGIKVTLINPEVAEKLYYNHGIFSAECYATPTDDATVVGRVGKGCMATQHTSGSRCEYFKFKIEADRGTVEQAQRAEIGSNYWPEEKYAEFDYEDWIELRQNIPADEVVKNSQSFRYVDKNNFDYVIPENIEKSEKALQKYHEIMNLINLTRQEMRDILIENGIDSYRAVEDANLILPRATMSKLTLGLTPEALIRFSWKRLCSRAQPFIHEVALGMKAEVEKYNPQFAKQLVPHCQHLMWCPEASRCCGAAPTKAQLKEMIANVKQ